MREIFKKIEGMNKEELRAYSHDIDVAMKNVKPLAFGEEGFNTIGQASILSEDALRAYNKLQEVSIAIWRRLSEIAKQEADAIETVEMEVIEEHKTCTELAREEVLAEEAKREADANDAKKILEDAIFEAEHRLAMGRMKHNQAKIDAYRASQEAGDAPTEEEAPKRVVVPYISDGSENSEAISVELFANLNGLESLDVIVQAYRDNLITLNQFASACSRAKRKLYEELGIDYARIGLVVNYMSNYGMRETNLLEADIYHYKRMLKLLDEFVERNKDKYVCYEVLSSMIGDDIANCKKILKGIEEMRSKQ